MKDFFYRMICGCIIGIGGVLPGVSGGIMAISMGLYEKMMSAIGHFFSDIKKNFSYLLPVAIGGGVGILLTSNVLKAVLERYEAPVLALFCGFVLGSIPSLLTEVKAEGGFRKRHAVAAICGLAFVLLFAVGESSMVDNSTVGNLDMLTALIAGGVLSIGVVIPGVSSSFILIYFGLYNAVLATIAGVMDFSILFSDGLGAAIAHLGKQLVPLLCMCAGFAAVALLLIKGVNRMLKKHHSISYAAIVGFVIGSVILILPKVFSGFHWTCIPLFLGGLAVSLLECRARAKRAALTVQDVPADVPEAAEGAPASGTPEENAPETDTPPDADE